MRILVEAVGDFDPAFELYYKNFTNAPFLRSSVNNRGVGEPEYMIVEDGPLALRVFDARNGTGSGKYKLTIARDDLSINDDCAGATFLVPADECTPVLGTLNRSNASNTGSGCESPSNSQIKDVWYKFRPTKTFIRATLSCWNNFNGQMQLFKGAGCQNLVLNSCVDSTGAGGQEVINQEGLIPGDVYFLRVAGTDTSGKGDFSLCLKYINCEADKPQISVIPQNSAVNGRLKLKTANIVSRLKWQYSINLGQSWNFLATTKLVDTITILPSMQGTMWIRAYAFDDSCRNGYSNIEVVNVKCASPFSNVLTHNTGDFIQSIRFAEKTVVSGSDSLGGSYQDFSRKDTLSICRSFPFSFHVYPGDSTKIYGKAVWLDLNRDGDFTDPNELQVISQPAAGTFSPVLSLASLGAGVYQMRIGLIRSNSGTIDSNACFQPGYLSGEFEDYSINVGVPQAANAGPDAAVCTDGVFLAGNHPAQTTGLWEAIGNTAQIANPGLFNSLVTGLAPGPNIFRWKVLSVCPVVTDDVVISRSLPPTTASILGLQSPVSVCTNTFRVTGNTPQIGTPLWTKIAGAATLATPSQPSTLLTGLVPGVKILRYSITNAPCPSSFQEITLNATNSLPTADAGLDMAICDSAVGLTGNAVGTGQGTWTVVSGAGTFSNASSPISSVSGLAPGVNMLKWSISKAGCNTSEDFVNIIRQLPENALAGTDQTTCAQSATLTAGPSSNPGTWSLVSGSGTLASPNSSTCVVSGLGEGVNIFRWTLNNPGCPVSSDDVAITVSQNAFVVSAGPDRTLCAQTSDTLNAILPAGTTGLWTVAGGGGAITQPTGATTQVTGLTPGINRFVWTISRPGCASVSDEVMVNIQSQPSSALAGPDVQVCRTLVSLHASAPLAGQGTWTVLNGSAQISDIHNPTAFASSLSDGANKFLWTVGNAPCSSREDTVIITSVSQSGLTALAGIDQTVCGTNGFMKAAGPVSGTGTWSLVSGSGILANPANPQSPVSALGGGANTFAWKVSLDTCSVTDIAIVSRDYNPVHLGNDTTLCTGSSLDINGGTGYATYAWSTLSGNANITVSATNLYSLTATTANGCAYSDSINVIFTICTDVKDPESGINPDVLLFPNPGTGVLHLKFQGLDERVQINVLGLDGKLLSSYEKDLSSAEPVVTLDLTNLANGIYMVEIQTKAKTFHNRVVVQK